MTDRVTAGPANPAAAAALAAAALPEAIMSVPLPDAIAAYKAAGRFAEAQAAITARLASPPLPRALRARLERERGVLDALAQEYPYRLAEAERLAGGPVDLADGYTDWRYVDGEPRLFRRFPQNLAKTRGEETPADAARRVQLREHMALMKARGGVTATLRLRAGLRIRPEYRAEYERPGARIVVHMPVPRRARQITGIIVIDADPAGAILAPEDAPQRTIRFDTVLEAGQEFSVEYAWRCALPYADLDAPPSRQLSPEPWTPADLAEEPPHIRFTPFMALLLDEILGGGAASSPLAAARAVYDFVTTRVRYAFTREYATIDNLSEYAAANLRGDCGVQALLFITLCRMAGVPARWQSGLSVSEYHVGCHDWAEFYVEPWGWLFADPSFGGSARRAGDAERAAYYFGNLDVYRMPANAAICAAFSPPKRHERADPVDNQTGEAEYDDRGVPGCALESTLEFKGITIE